MKAKTPFVDCRVRSNRYYFNPCFIWRVASMDALYGAWPFLVNTIVPQYAIISKQGYLSGRDTALSVESLHKEA